MAKQLKVTLVGSVQANYVNADALGQPGEVFNKTFRTELAPGAGDGQVDRMYRAELSVNASTSVDLDLSGVLVDVFGEALTLSKVKAIRIQARPDNVSTLTVRRKAANGAAIFETAGDGVVLEPGAWVEIGSPKAGFTVAGGTGDLVEVANGAGGTAKCDVIIIGND